MAGERRCVAAAAVAAAALASPPFSAHTSRRRRASSSMSVLRFLSRASWRARAAGSRSIQLMNQPFSVSSATTLPVLPRYLMKVVSVSHFVLFMWIWNLSAIISLYTWVKAHSAACSSKALHDKATTTRGWLVWFHRELLPEWAGQRLLLPGWRGTAWCCGGARASR